MTPAPKNSTITEQEAKRNGFNTLEAYKYFLANQPNAKRKQKVVSSVPFDAWNVYAILACGHEQLIRKRSGRVPAAVKCNKCEAVQ